MPARSAEERKRFASMGARAQRESAERAAVSVLMLPPCRYSMLELVRCAEREAASRKQTYPRLIKEGQMSRALAEAEIGRMEAIAGRLKAMAEIYGWR